MFAKAVAFAAALTIALALATGSAAAGGGCHPPADGATQRSGSSIDVKGCAFGPTVLRAPVGAKVTWTNLDVIPHAIAGSGWVAAQDPITQGATASYTFDKAGVYPYMCFVHPGMAGVVVVGDAPFLPVATDLPVTNAARANAPSPAPVDVPLAVSLVLGAALGAAGMAVVDRRYRWMHGAAAIRRGHGVHAG